ncbi:MAG: IS1380 family transposase [bacterium]|nr:IS1380 family transposase [bacterium]
MSQGVLPFQYEEEKKSLGQTGLAGLPVYLDLIHRMGLRERVENHIGVRGLGQGWTDTEMVMSLVFLNLAGGDCVEDLRILESDEGFCRVLDRVRHHGLPRRQRRAMERRWRKERRRSVPSPSAAFRYLSEFHDPEQETLRQSGRAFIPAPNEYLCGFRRVCSDMAAFSQRQDFQGTATLDMDATLVETRKSGATYCYKNFKAYQPFNVWWAEHEMVLHTEFRDGNVPAGYQQLRVLEESLELLPEGVEQVRVRSDGAGYQHDLLRYCEMGDCDRFGRIEFAIGCDVTSEFKRAVSEVAECDWRPVYKKVDGKMEKTDREWAEVCFVPDAIGHSKKGPSYRYLATREVLRQPALPGLEDGLSLPFPVLEIGRQGYKIRGVVTNMDWDGSTLIDWLYQRCGKSEQAHAVMKDDLAGGKMPSGDFGQNAAWWWIMVLAFNLNSVMKRLVLGKEWIPKRLKAIRFHLIGLPGRLVRRSRQLVVRLAKGHPSFQLLVDARKTIAGLLPAPAG